MALGGCDLILQNLIETVNSELPNHIDVICTEFSDRLELFVTSLINMTQLLKVYAVVR